MSFWIWAWLALAPWANAAEPVGTCGLTFGSISVSADYTRPRLTDEDQRIIRAQFDRPDLTDEGKLQAAYDAYLAARLREVPAELRKWVESEIANLVKPPTDDGSVRASASGVSFPRCLVGSACFFASVTHEAEHNIQIAGFTQGQYNLSSLAKLFGMVLSPRRIFETEQGAMRAEWEFLRLVPPAYLLKSLNLVLDQVKSPGARKFLVNIVNSVQLPLDQYLERQHRIGRYGAAAANQIAAQRGKVLFGASAAAGFLAHQFILCTVLRRAGASESAYYRKLCF